MRYFYSGVKRDISGPTGRCSLAKQRQTLAYGHPIHPCHGSLTFDVSSSTENLGEKKRTQKDKMRSNQLL
ncbi:hypothetical protein QE152_g40446 [Popillia japonica]|uniref:Uncharacterized protein n=1 Tax=Popillia japonica TaxID=7064 RepID=A0AAW1HRD7_POPJA